MNMFSMEGVTKRFGDFVAVDSVSFHVKPNEILGFLGENGAGKSTTMRILSGYLPPDEGRVLIGGHDIVKESVEARRLIGYLPENAPVYQDMTVEGFLRYCGELRGLSGTALSDAVERVLGICHLEQRRSQCTGTLSKGYVHRTCLAQTLLHDPPGLILDEPTDGLDPVQKREMQALIREMGKTKAIILSTHILEEVKAVCTRVIVISHGKICLDAPMADVRDSLYELLAKEHGVAL